VLIAAGACTEEPDGAPEADPGSAEASPSDPPTVSPSPTPEVPPEVTLTVVGDLMLVRDVPDPVAALAPLRERLSSADITVGNLESTLSTDGEPTQGGDSFGGSPALLGPLRRAGFDALSLANNHTGDYGSNALVDTVRAFDGSRIASFGAGSGLAEASRPTIIERAGLRFAFVGFNAIGETPRAEPGTPGALSVRMPPRTGPLAPADLDHVASVVRRAGRAADVVPHWGTQYTHAPEPIQRTVARRLVDAGADLVVGGHPHWVQTAERVKGVPVLHSLGNFVFDMDFMAETMEGVFLETTWRGDELIRTRLVPYRLDPGTFAPRVVRGAAAREILAQAR
jgi:poly-gamma-glutamate capsule biosynthesis protein CapA/YwtB (metallophosphatase superfamily)